MTNKKMYYTIKAVMGFSFFMLFTAAIIYRIDIVGLEVFELILLGTALEVSVFLFEVPTGVIADLKSRKLSVVIGLLIIGSGFVLEALTKQFIVIFIAQIVWGLGYTFISGALDSWISDEEQNIGIEKIYITGAQVDKMFSVLGIILAAVIGSINVVYAIYLPGILMMLTSLFTAFLMKEEHFQKQHHDESLLKSYFSHLFKGFKHVKSHSILKIMFFIMLFYGLYSEGIDRTYELHILDNLNFRGSFNLSAIWVIASINAFIAIIGSIILEYVKRYVDQSKYMMIYTIAFTLLMSASLVVFAYSPRFIALSGFIIFTVSRQGLYPLLNAIVIKNTPSQIKATVMSSFGQLDAIGQLLSGALMVVVSVLFGLRGMYLVTALILIVPALLLIKIYQSNH